MIFIAPIAITNPILSDFFIKNFVISIIIFCIMFIASEFINLSEDWKNDSEQKRYRNEIKELEGNIKSLEANIKTLEDERDDANSYSEEVGLYLESLPPVFLKNVSIFLGLKNCDRISLYVLNSEENGEEFRIIGRYSENPKFRRIVREKYPSDCGYIAKCLNNNNGNPYFVREGLPKNLEKYVERVSKETGMSVDLIKNLSMKSRSYFTRVIKDSSDLNVGILVIESMNSKFHITSDEMNNNLEKLSIPYMSALLDVSNKIKGGNSDES